MIIILLATMILILSIALGVTTYQWMQDTKWYSTNLEFWQKQCLYLEARSEKDSEQLRISNEALDKALKLIQDI